MSTFQQLLDAQLGPPEQRDARFDTYRRIEAVTERPLIVYAADFLTPAKHQSENFSAHVSLDYNDVLGFKNLVSSVPGDSIDVILHSPGGLGEAAERLVNLLRTRFKKHVRFIVPHSSFSAATMLCFSGDCIAMNDVSALGPIDPQVNGVPARAIKKGFERVKRAVGKTPGALAPYLPLLQKYDLHIFEICDNAEKQSKKLASRWLTDYMFAADKPSSFRVRRIVRHFATHDRHLSHSRSVGIDECIKLGLKVHDLRSDERLGPLIWEAWERIEFYFGKVPVAKLFENAYGVSFVRLFPPPRSVLQLAGPLPFVPGPSAPPEAPPKGSAPQNQT
jgi:hypothetical protein